MVRTLQPDLSGRPHRLVVDRVMRASPRTLYAAWTDRFDSWFAEPGETLMSPATDRAFFFYNRRDRGREPHYGRFLRLEEDALVEMTWVTGKAGTGGTETLLLIELTAMSEGTHLRLTHSGFDEPDARDRHEQAWPEALEILDEMLAP